MPRPNTTVTFTGSGSPSTLTVTAPSPNVDAPVTTPKAINRTQGGSLVQFKIGQDYWETTLVLEHLSNADKGNLEAFFRNNGVGSFTYTDENSNNFTAYFLDQTLPLTKNFRNLWTGRVHMQLSSVLA